MDRKTRMLNRKLYKYCKDQQLNKKSPRTKCVYWHCPHNCNEIRWNLDIGAFKPRTEGERVRWEGVLGMPITMDTNVCELHFNEDQVFKHKENGKKHLLPQAVPFRITQSSPFSEDNWKKQSHDDQASLLHSLNNLENRCAVAECPNSNKAQDFDVLLFKPRNRDERESWSQILNTELTNMCSVCHCHFNNDQIQFKSSGGKIELMAGATPNPVGDGGNYSD